MKTKTILLAACMVMSLPSCMKDYTIGDQRQLIFDQQAPITITEAGQILEQRLERFSKITFTETSFITHDFTPIWKQAVFSTTKQGTRLIVPIRSHSPRTLHARIDNIPGRAPKESYETEITQSLVFLKSERGIRLYIQSVIPDIECYKRYSGKIFVYPYDEKFSGFYVIHTLAGREVYLDVISRGELTWRKYLADIKDSEDRHARFRDSWQKTGHVCYLARRK